MFVRPLAIYREFSEEKKHTKQQKLVTRYTLNVWETEHKKWETRIKIKYAIKLELPKENFT